MCVRARVPSWLYRILPAVSHSPMTKMASTGLVVSNWADGAPARRAAARIGSMSTMPRPRVSSRAAAGIVDATQIRWKPMPFAEGKVDWLEGLTTMSARAARGLWRFLAMMLAPSRTVGAGDVASKSGLAIHMYACNASMVNRAFCNSDGDMLIGEGRGLSTELPAL